MIRSYFIIALRNFIRNKVQSSIQVLSLAIGIASLILIGLYARFEFSYDQFNENYDRIYRLEFDKQVGLWSAIGHQIKQEIPEVENVVRMLNWWGKDRSTLWFYYPEAASDKKRIFKAEDLFYCDTTVFDIFSFNFLQGDPETALRDPMSIVLTKSMAKKYFGDQDPVGQYLVTDKNYPITGIIEDVKGSHMEIKMLGNIAYRASIGHARRGDPTYLNSYTDANVFMTYLLLPEKSDPEYFEKRINEFFQEKWTREFGFADQVNFSLRPLRDIYMTTNLENEQNNFRHGNLKLMKILLVIAVFILVLAIINYINLTTARASIRAREVSIRRIAGCTKNKLILQFLAEALLVSFFSFLLALTIIQLVLPGFNRLAATDLTIVPASLHELLIIGGLMIILIGLASGLYPSLYMTRLKALIASSDGLASAGRPAVFRRIMLTFQYIISVILIIGVSVILKQLHFMRHTDLGFNREQVVNLRYGWLMRDQSTRDQLKQKLLENPSIKGVSFSQHLVGGEQNITSRPVTIQGIERQVSIMGIDPDFFDVMEIELLEGRNFSWDRQADTDGTNLSRIPKIVINETAMREFEMESFVGSFMDLGGQKFEIIGVIRDFHFKSQHEKIVPTFYFWRSFSEFVNIKIAADNIPATMRFIKKEVESMLQMPFHYTFLEETFNKQYEKDERTARVIGSFAIVAVLIACLGLLGLSTFMAARRTKEIGIRKALGSSDRNVFTLLFLEFLKWVTLSLIIACPLAWYIMDRWLQNYAYRSRIGAWIFLLAIAVAYGISFLTVAWQSWKTAHTNPVEALRYE
jgi:putative ABC transport system permease protein